MQLDYVEKECPQRLKKFLWKAEILQDNLQKNPSAAQELEIVHDVITVYCKSDLFLRLSDTEKMIRVFTHIFNAIRRTTEETQLCESMQLNMLHISEFHTLCSFLNYSRRIKGKSLSEFVKASSPLNFSDPDSPNYLNLSLCETEVERLKKSRTRMLSCDPAYNKKTQWHAIPKDVDYEWEFYYDIEKEPRKIQESFKRQKNLYSDIHRAISAARDAYFLGNLNKAYEKFLSKLSKWKYEDYVALQKCIIERICRNKEYYGINLYRLERRMSPYTIADAVKRLTKCTEPDEAVEVLLKTTDLMHVVFPAPYNRLFELPVEEARQLADAYQGYIKKFAFMGCLLLDELVEQKKLGDNWENMFRDRINELSETLLYDPKNIDFAITEKSEKYFHEILHASVYMDIAPYKMLIAD